MTRRYETDSVGLFARLVLFSVTGPDAHLIHVEDSSLVTSKFSFYI